MAKDPAMPLYVNDWLSSQRIALMSLEHQGAYIRLLCYCWASGDASLPDDDAILSRLSGMGEGWFTNGSQMVRVCFEPHPTKAQHITHKKLLSLWNERQEWREKSRIGGVKSGAARRSGTKGGSRVVQPPYEPKGNSSSSSSSSFSSSSSSSLTSSSSPSSASSVDGLGDSGEAPAPPAPSKAVAAMSTDELELALKQKKREEANRKRAEKRAAERAIRDAAKAADVAEFSERVNAVVRHYQTYHPRAFLNGIAPDSEDWNPVVERLKAGFTVEDLCQAIDGCHVTPHNCGQNKTGQKWQGLELICRTNDQVTRFIESHQQHVSGAPILTETSMHNRRVSQRWSQRQSLIPEDDHESEPERQLRIAAGSVGGDVPEENR